MAVKNDQRIAEALNVLQTCLRIFVERHLRDEYKERWLEKARLSLADFRSSYTGSVTFDVQALIRIATDKRHQVLYNALSPRDRNFLHELREVRNRHAHQVEFDSRDVERALDTLELFLNVIHAPEAASISSMRRPGTTEARLASTTSKPAAPAAELLKSARLVEGADMQRGVRLFRYVAAQANRADSVGIGYGDFIAFIHGKASFQEVAGRNFLPGDSPAVIDLAWSITKLNGGRIDVAAGELTIKSGMDSYIWQSKHPYDRSEKAFSNPKCRLPYSREDWKKVFPDDTRRLIKTEELEKLA